jgi:hypothetical protein
MSKSAKLRRVSLPSVESWEKHLIEVRGFSAEMPRASTSTSSPTTAELFSQVRDNGRISDDFKIVLGGTDCLEAEFSLGKIFNDPVIASHTISIQRSPQGFAVRPLEGHRHACLREGRLCPGQGRGRHTSE